MSAGRSGRRGAATERASFTRDSRVPPALTEGSAKGRSRTTSVMRTPVRVRDDHGRRIAGHERIAAPALGALHGFEQHAGALARQRREEAHRRGHVGQQLGAQRDQRPFAREGVERLAIGPDLQWRLQRGSSFACLDKRKPRTFWPGASVPAVLGGDQARGDTGRQLPLRQTQVAVRIVMARLWPLAGVRVNAHRPVVPPRAPPPPPPRPAVTSGRLRRVLPAGNRTPLHLEGDAGLARLRLHPDASGRDTEDSDLASRPDADSTGRITAEDAADILAVSLDAVLASLREDRCVSALREDRVPRAWVGRRRSASPPPHPPPPPPRAPFPPRRYGSVSFRAYARVHTVRPNPAGRSRRRRGAQPPPPAPRGVRAAS